MALTLSDLSADDVQQAERLLIQVIQDEYPSMDLGRGRVLRELLIRPSAIFYALNEANMDQLRRSMSLQQIASDPTLASDDIVDGVLSNLLLTRDVGAAASGQIRVIISSKSVTPVDSDAVFVANGLNFVATQAFVGVTSTANVVSTGSRLITERLDGNFEFLIDVEAAASGTSYNLAEGTRLTTVNTIPRLIDLITANDFSGGRARETNAALADRAQQGLSPRVLSGRSHIEALLTENFENIVDISTIGYGDSEMVRDKHNMFELSHGGKSDIWVRTGSIPDRALLSKTATMLDKITNTLTLTLDRDEAAGSYAVLAVYREGATPFQLQGTSEPTLIDSLTISSKVWTYDTTATGDEFVPDIETASEAAFSRYRKVVVTFIDTQSVLAEGETGTYQVYLLRLPNIDEIQDYVNDRARRNPGADYLVRAPIPAICSIGIQVAARNTGEVDANVIKNAVAARVNALGFTIGHLPGSAVIDAAQGQLPSDGVLDLPLNMLARLYLPDGTERVVAGTDELRVPSDITDSQVSARTVAWFVRTSDIDVSVREIATPEV